MAVPLTLSSVPAQTPYVQYVSGSGQTVFPYPFEITQDSDLVCLINGVAQPTDGGYTLSGQGSTNGGNLTFTVGQTAGTIITLYRNISIARITQLAQNGTFFAANFNNEFNRIYLIMQQLQQSLLPGGNQAYALMIPNSNSPAPVTLLTAANYANKYLSFDANGNPQPAVLTTSGSVTASLIAGLLNGGSPSSVNNTVIGTPQTAAESTAGVTPINLFYPPCNVDRYGTNTTPGTTAMDTAFQKAVNVAKVSGLEVTYGDTAPYLLTAAIDCTTAVSATNYAISIRGRANNQAITTNAPYRPALIAKHNAVAVFDCTGASAINFQNMSITTDTSTYPTTCFLMARNVNANSQVARFDNVHVYGYFSDSVHYNYGSEDDVHTGCYYINALTSGAIKCVRITANNISSLTSSFTTIDTGTVSTIDHNYVGCQFQNLSTNASADLIYLEAGGNVRFQGCWGYAAGGRALFYYDGTNSFTTGLTVRDWITESISAQTYFVDISNNAHTVSNLRLDNVTNYSSSYLINVAGASPLVDEFNLNAIFDVNNHGINIPGTIQNSVVFYFGPMTLGTSSGNELHGAISNWTITTRTADFWYGWASGDISWTPNTSGLTVTGALTVSNKRIQYEGQLVRFTVALSAATSIVCSAGTNLGGLPLAVAVSSADVHITNTSANTGLPGGSVSSGTNVTLPAINVGANVPIVISGSYFAA